MADKPCDSFSQKVNRYICENMNTSITLSAKDRVISFIWQHMLLLVSLFIMTLGVVLCVRSNLGSSVISSAPLAFALGGTEGTVPPLSLGNYTNILNALFVIGQILVLRRQFELMQLFQLAIGIVFGTMIDLNMALTSSLECDTLPWQITTQVAGCTVMGIGVALEVRCDSVTMPGEGLPVAISRVSNIPFPKAKIFVDTSLVALAVASCYCFWGEWRWNIVGVGTLVAMVLVGLIVRIVSAHLLWFDRLLCYRPGFRRYIFGLARYIYSRIN